MKSLKKIGLAKLFLWSEAERIQAYPEAFANLDGSRLYTGHELAIEVFGLVEKREGGSTQRNPKGSAPGPLKTGLYHREDPLKNCFGLDPLSDGKVVIRGINCLRKAGKDRFKATEEALAIGQGYKIGKDQDAWAVPLARQIARFEVRTRLFLDLLGREGCCLTFPAQDLFALPSVKARLIRGDESLAPFENQGEEFNRLLQKHRQVALGPWWRGELEHAGYQIDEAFRFEGIQGGPPPTNKLNSNIKASLFLMKYLGVLESRKGGWMVCPERAIEVLGEAIANDFIEAKGMTMQGHSPLSILKSLAGEIRDEGGFVIVSRLARSWASRNGVSSQKAQEAFDQFMREQIYEGTVRIAARHEGQPRHGRGLFGEERMRKIKLEFH